MRSEVPKWAVGVIVAVIAVVLIVIGYNVMKSPTAKLRTEEDMAKQKRSAPPAPMPVPGM